MCTYDNCELDSVVRNYCRKHYKKLVRCGTLKIKHTRPKNYTEYKSELSSWRNMKYRCYVKSNSAYKYYGARGIRVCDRWKNSFENFLEDMGPKKSNDLSLDRINNDGNYTPENCKWSTKEEQVLNRRQPIRRSSSHKNVTFFKITGRWRATITRNRKQKHLGYFNTESQAIKAVNKFLQTAN